MKRLALPAALVLVLLLCACCAAAEEEIEFLETNDFWYAVNDEGGAELVWYNGEEENVVIPAELDGHPVTGIMTNPFPYNDFTVSVTSAPDHPYLAVIDGVLFEKESRRLVCYPIGLEAASYAVPDGTTAIGHAAFCNNEHLAAVAIPDSVTSIGKNAFEDCVSLADVNIPGTVTVIEDWAFSSCWELTSVAIPDSVTEIGEGAFFGSGLIRVTIPAGVTAIGEDAFAYCDDSLTISVTAGSYAETWCAANGLSYVTFNPGEPAG